MPAAPLGKLGKLVGTLSDLQEDNRRSKLQNLVPNGPQMEIISDKGAKILAMMAGNRVGKTTVGAAIVAAHATGRYPDWWTGYRFNGAVSIWAAGVTSESTRDIIQHRLLGKLGVDRGEDAWLSGMIPADTYIKHTMRRGIDLAIDEVMIRHVSGDVSVIGFKAIEQGAAKFQGTKKHLIWLDEEPGSKHESMLEIVQEAATRTMGVPGGKVMITYTPCHGMTPLCTWLMEPSDDMGNVVRVVNATWDDVQHLSAVEKARQASCYLPHEVEARTKGVPTLKEGLVFPFAESSFVVDPFPVPRQFYTVIGADVARGGTWAAVQIFRDPASDVAYVTKEFSGQGISRRRFAEVLSSWGENVYVAIDPAANQREIDGTKTISELRSMGLNCYNASNRVSGEHSGIQQVFDLLSEGKLKIFRTCHELLREMRVYRYKNGSILKKDDHIVDAMRYGVTSLSNARPASYFRRQARGGVRHSRQWQPADSVVGY